MRLTLAFTCAHLLSRIVVTSRSVCLLTLLQYTSILRGFSKYRSFHYQFLIVLFRFPSILGVMQQMCLQNFQMSPLFLMTHLNQPIYPPLLQVVLWRYKFSQLKGSSDDGKTRVKLLFKNAESQQIEMKVNALRHYTTKAFLSVCCPRGVWFTVYYYCSRLMC